MLTLGQAAKAAGVSRSTLSRAIKAGRLNAHQDDGWVYRIDAGELARVFGGTAMPEAQDDSLPDMDSAPAAIMPRPAMPAAPVMPAMPAIPALRAAAPARDYSWEVVHPSPEPPKPVTVAAPARPTLLQRIVRMLGGGQSARA
jgi:excisionase family DNA binding protein